MRENTALTAWRANEQTVGGWLSIGNAYTAETMANLGFDWLCIDMQHGMLSYDDLKYMLPAISTTATIPIVRVPLASTLSVSKQSLHLPVVLDLFRRQTPNRPSQQP